jgi:hypothetical protein
MILISQKKPRIYRNVKYGLNISHRINDTTAAGINAMSSIAAVCATLKMI